ncbi:MAG: hypothetical protein ACYS1A_08270 [Planctomycetota bacterium]|jgi:DNA-binding XRE family transcriptional regulator
MTTEKYIPKNCVDIKRLFTDLNDRQDEFKQETLAGFLGISRPALTQKLSGRRAWKENELIIIASRLGKNYRDYLIEAA